jgi:hypothetical protein
MHMTKLPETKEQFHRFYARILRQIASKLPGAEVHSNKAGPVCLGDVYLNAEGLHVCVGGSFFSLKHPFDAQFYYRWEDRDQDGKMRRNRHTAMGVNRWLKLSDLHTRPEWVLGEFIAARDAKC